MDASACDDLKFLEALRNPERNTRGVTMEGVCLLCLKTDTLKRSHYVPASVLKMIGLDLHSVSTSGIGCSSESGSHENVRNDKSPQHWGVPLFCEACESVFNAKYESGNKIKNIFGIAKFDGQTDLKWTYENGSTTDERKVDQKDLVCILSSILWRTILVTWFDLHRDTKKWLFPWLRHTRRSLLGEFSEVPEHHLHLYIDDLKPCGHSRPAESTYDDDHWCIGEIEFRSRNVGYDQSLVGVASVQRPDANDSTYAIHVGRFWIVLCKTGTPHPERKEDCSTGHPLKNRLQFVSQTVNFATVCWLQLFAVLLRDDEILLHIFRHS